MEIHFFMLLGVFEKSISDHGLYHYFRWSAIDVLDADLFEDIDCTSTSYISTITSNKIIFTLLQTQSSNHSVLGKV